MDTTTKLKIKFKHRKVNDQNVMTADCDASEALFNLMSPRKYIYPAELIHIAKMGFEYEVRGDLREFKAEVTRLENTGHFIEGG